MVSILDNPQIFNELKPENSPAIFVEPTFSVFTDTSSSPVLEIPETAYPIHVTKSDRIVSSEDNVFAKNEAVKSNDNFLQKQLNEENFIIRIEEVKFDLDNEDVRNLIKNTQQIFVGYEFLNFAPEDLESRSILLNADGVLSVDFDKGND